MQNVVECATIVVDMTTKIITEPSALLFSDSFRRLLGLLFMRPDEDFHVREIARITDLDAANAQRTLKRMAAAGLVSTSRAGNQLRYQADRNCPIFEELSSIVRKTSGLADVLREALIPLAERISVAFVFGSIAKGEAGPHSDIDLMVIGGVSFEALAMVLHDAEGRLGRPVNAVILSAAEFHEKRLRREGFITRILAEPKILLMGVLDEP